MSSSDALGATAWSHFTSDRFIRIGGILALVLLGLAGLIFFASIRLFGYEKIALTLSLTGGVLVAILVIFGVVGGVLTRWRMTKLLERAYYESIDFNWQFTANGDFYGRYAFTFVNGSDEPIVLLPKVDFLFWGEPDPPNVRYRVLNTGQKHHRLEANGHQIVKAISRLLNMDYSRVEFDLYIQPPVRAGDNVSFEIEMETNESERDAFTKGTYLGIPAPILIKKACLYCAAPPGFKFVLLEPFGPIVVDLQGNRQPDQDHVPIPAPTLGPGGGTLKWELNDLAPERRYWLKYKFEPTGA
jgi:hypothetical protein